MSRKNGISAREDASDSVAQIIEWPTSGHNYGEIRDNVAEIKGKPLGRYAAKGVETELKALIDELNGVLVTCQT